MPSAKLLRLLNVSVLQNQWRRPELFPSPTTAEVPANADGRDVKYKLVDIFEPNGPWNQRHCPWAWDDGNDAPGRGELATDPAKLVPSNFKSQGAFDLNYVRNKCKGITH